jgi:hypothetical protein
MGVAHQQGGDVACNRERFVFGKREGSLKPNGTYLGSAWPKHQDRPVAQQRKSMPTIKYLLTYRV